MRYKSKFEKTVSGVLGRRAQYEPDKLEFIQPAKKRTYIPDWRIQKNVYIETKGKFTPDDRQKMVWVKEQYPDCTFYILFQNAFNRIRKNSSTTYADWCEKAGFEWAHYPDGIPKHWFTRRKNDEN